MLEQSGGKQQVSMAPTRTTTNCQFFACYEDSSFIYRHRKRPRSGESPFDASPASSTTTDSLLTNSANFTDSSTSSTSSGDGGLSNCSSRTSGRSSSKSLSSPPLTFNLLSTNSPGGSAQRQLTALAPPSPPLTTATKASDSAASLASAETKRTRAAKLSRTDHDETIVSNDENEPQQLNTNTSKTITQDEHERVFNNLILRERRFGEARASLSAQLKPALQGQLRHSLLSWMLRICEHQLCQDEIFPLATIILDNFLLINPMIPISHPGGCYPEDEVPLHRDHEGAPGCSPTTFGAAHCQMNHVYHSQHHGRTHRHYHRHHHHHRRHQEFVASGPLDDDQDQTTLLGSPRLDAPELELEQRQLLLFAACSLLLATKLRQTPRLYIQTLIEFSKFELPIELGRGEIIDGELLMLSMLKWDLAALVTPNEFLQELLSRKCRRVLMNFLKQTGNSNEDDEAAQDNPHRPQWQHSDSSNKCKLVNRVNRHTQTLLELCLMDSQLSQYPSSILAMSSMAVAINGLSKTTKSACLGLEHIVVQIHESTNKVNELELMIDVAFQIEKYVQTLLHSAKDD